MRNFTVNKRALKYNWKITDEVPPLLISKNRTWLHSPRHPCQLCLPACPSKVIGRVSNSSCLFIWFPGGDECLPMLHCLEIPPPTSVFNRLPSGHNASGGRWLEVSQCDLPGNRSNHTLMKEKYFPHPLQGGWGCLPVRRSLTLWFNPFKDHQTSLNFPPKREVACSRLLKCSLFNN